MPALSNSCVESILDALVQGGEIGDAHRDEFLCCLAERLEGQEYKAPNGIWQLLGYLDEYDLEVEMGQKSLLWCCCGCERWHKAKPNDNGFCSECVEDVDASTTD